jgi:hypothetical protein
MHKKTVLLFTASLFLSSCLTIKPIEFRSIENYKLSKDLQKPEITVDVKLYNPNNWGLKLKKASLDVTSGESTKNSIGTTESLRIKRKSEFTISLSGEASLAEITKIGIGSLFKGNSPINFKGEIIVKKWFLRKRFGFDNSTDLNGLFRNGK